MAQFAECPDRRPLRSDVQSEGDGAQVAVGRGVVDDALAVEFALYIDMSVVLHACKTNSYHGGGVVYLRPQKTKGFQTTCLTLKSGFVFYSIHTQCFL